MNRLPERFVLFGGLTRRERPTTGTKTEAGLRLPTNSPNGAARRSGTGLSALRRDHGDHLKTWAGQNPWLAESAIVYAHGSCGCNDLG